MSQTVTSSQDSAIGAWPVVLTPYDRYGRVDVDALTAHVEWLIDRGVAGLFPVALSGEMFELDEHERHLVAATVVAASAGRVPVAASVASNAGDAMLIEDARALQDAGVTHPVLIPSLLARVEEPDAQLLERAARVLDALPEGAFGLYECPRPYHRVLQDDAVRWFAASDRFAFFKEVSGSRERALRRLELTRGSRLRVYSAGTDNLIEMMRAGAAGMSGWVANTFPDVVQWLALNPDHEDAPAVQEWLRSSHRAYEQTYPNSAKYLVANRASGAFAVRSRWHPTDIDEPDLDRQLAELAQLGPADAPWRTT